MRESSPARPRKATTSWSETRMTEPRRKRLDNAHPAPPRHLAESFDPQGPELVPRRNPRHKTIAPPFPRTRNAIDHRVHRLDPVKAHVNRRLRLHVDGRDRNPPSRPGDEPIHNLPALLSLPPAPSPAMPSDSIHRPRVLGRGASPRPPSSGGRRQDEARPSGERFVLFGVQVRPAHAPGGRLSSVGGRGTGRGAARPRPRRRQRFGKSGGPRPALPPTVIKPSHRCEERVRVPALLPTAVRSAESSRSG